MNQQATNCTDWEKQNFNNTKRLFYWTASWLISTALAAFGPKSLWDFDVWLTIGAIILNLALGFRMILANKALLQNLDELQQKIQTSAMSLSLGVGLVIGVTYEQLEDALLISFEPDISHMMIIMALTYLLGIFLGQRHYR